MVKFSAVGIEFGDEGPGTCRVGVGAAIDLEVITVGAEDSFGEADRLVAARPVKCGLEHDFFSRITLRLVETSGRLGFAEYISHAVIADAVAGTEVGVGVVVEGAPADAAGVLRI